MAPSSGLSGSGTSATSISSTCPVCSVSCGSGASVVIACLLSWCSGNLGVVAGLPVLDLRLGGKQAVQVGLRGSGFHRPPRGVVDDIRKRHVLGAEHHDGLVFADVSAFDRDASVLAVNWHVLTPVGWWRATRTDARRTRPRSWPCCPGT